MSWQPVALTQLTSEEFGNFFELTNAADLSRPVLGVTFELLSEIVSCIAPSKHPLMQMHFLRTNDASYCVAHVKGQLHFLQFLINLVGSRQLSSHRTCKLSHAIFGLLSAIDGKVLDWKFGQSCSDVPASQRKLAWFSHLVINVLKCKISLLWLSHSSFVFHKKLKELFTFSDKRYVASSMSRHLTRHPTACCVYCWFCPTTRKMYVGKTIIGLHCRTTQHLRQVWCSRPRRDLPWY